MFILYAVHDSCLTPSLCRRCQGPCCPSKKSFEETEACSECQCHVTSEGIHRLLAPFSLNHGDVLGLLEDIDEEVIVDEDEGAYISNDVTIVVDPCIKW